MSFTAAGCGHFAQITYIHASAAVAVVAKTMCFITQQHSPATPLTSSNYTILLLLVLYLTLPTNAHHKHDCMCLYRLFNSLVFRFFDYICIHTEIAHHMHAAKSLLKYLLILAHTRTSWKTQPTRRHLRFIVAFLWPSSLKANKCLAYHHIPIPFDRPNRSSSHSVSGRWSVNMQMVQERI